LVEIGENRIDGDITEYIQDNGFDWMIDNIQGSPMTMHGGTINGFL
jgi:hypothetical protein